MQRRLAMLKSSPMWSEDSEGHALPIACHAERSLPNARRQIHRGTKGQ
jgi:hypothetical protein